MTQPPLSPYAVRIGRAQSWSEVIAKSEPTVMVTLGTNRAIGEKELIGSISEALHRLDCERNGTKRVQKIDPKRRVTAFIALEKLKLNAHAHLAVWHQSLLLSSRDSKLVDSFARTRDGIDFIGYGCKDYTRENYYSDPYLAARLEHIWRSLVPGAHYHARRFDPATRTHGADYLVKELKFFDERDIYLSPEFWPEHQRKASNGIVFERLNK